jgi:hypothetical protein
MAEKTLNDLVVEIFMLGKDEPENIGMRLVELQYQIEKLITRK